MNESAMLHEAAVGGRFGVEDLLPHLPFAYVVVGNASRRFSRLCATLPGDEEALAFIAEERPDRQVLAESTRAAVVICEPAVEVTAAMAAERCFIRTEHPKYAFAHAANRLFPRGAQWGVHPQAWVHPEAEVDPESYIGPFSVVGRCSIGRGSVIVGSCHLYDGVRVGRNVLIHAGCVLGADGFGHLRHPDGGAWEPFPHVGGIVIEDDVEIGANTCIDRGSLGDTVIRRGAKIDNLVHIAHNVEVGRHAVVIAHAMIGGSTRIGDHAWISPTAALRDQISIGERVSVGMGAVVTRSIPDGEAWWAGAPARPLPEFLAVQKKLKALAAE